MSGKLQQIHLRVNDAATGQPTPVRLRVTDAQGNYYAPFGRLTAFATEPGVDVGNNVLLDDGAWAVIDGACELAVPAGALRVQVTKGPEYRPVDSEMQLAAGKMSLRLTIERWQDLRAEGWYSGDTCAYFLSPHAALLEAAATDLAVVDLLARMTTANGGVPGLTNISAFSGQQPALARPGHQVVVNTCNEGPDGRLLLLNCHRVVYPLTYAPTEKWGLLDWCGQCHRKGGLVVADDWLAGREMSDEVLRNVDAIRFLPDCLLEPWFAALNRGLKLPLVAGSGKQSNHEVLGSWRTYAQVASDTPFDYRAWTEAIRAGRTYVTCGPQLRLTVADKVRAEAEALTALDRLELVHNGRIVAERVGPDVRLALEVPAEAGWYVARCVGGSGVQTVTSAAWV